MGDSVTEGQVAEWIKGVGDFVQEDDLLCVVDTDKVAQDIMSPVQGEIIAIHTNEGDTVEVGTKMVEIRLMEAGTPAPEPTMSAPPTPTAAPTMAPVAPPPKLTKPTSTGETHTIHLPTMGDSVTEGQLAEWIKNVGDFVQEDDLVCVVDTDKVAQDIMSPVQGEITVFHVEEGATVEVGDKLVDIALMDWHSSEPKMSLSTPAAAPAPPVAAPTPPPAAPRAPTPTPPPSYVPAPAARPPPRKKTAMLNQTPLPKFDTAGVTKTERQEIRQPLTRIRKAIARRLKESQNTAAFLTTFNEIDMTNLIDMRDAHKDDFFESHGVKP